MEPLSIWMFTLIATALGVGLTVAGKKKTGKCCSSEAKAEPVVKTVKRQVSERHPEAEGRGPGPFRGIAKAEGKEVFDAEKEKAIDALIGDKD